MSKGRIRIYHGRVVRCDNVIVRKRTRMHGIAFSFHRGEGVMAALERNKFFGVLNALRTGEATLHTSRWRPVSDRYRPRDGEKLFLIPKMA